MQLFLWDIEVNLENISKYLFGLSYIKSNSKDCNILYWICDSSCFVFFNRAAEIKYGIDSFAYAYSYLAAKFRAARLISSNKVSSTAYWDKYLSK